MNIKDTQRTDEPLLKGRFLVFFSLYMIVNAVVSVLVFWKGSGDGSAWLFSLPAAYGTVSLTRMAFVIFGRSSVDSSRGYFRETLLLFTGGLPAGLVAADASAVALSNMLSVEFLILSLLVLSGSVALYRKRARWHADLIYTGAAVAFSLGAPFLWFQAAHYADKRWDFLLSFSPFYHGAAAAGESFSAGASLIFGVIVLMLGTGITYLSLKADRKKIGTA